MSISTMGKLLLLVASAMFVVACDDEKVADTNSALSVAKSEISKNSTETATPIDSEAISDRGSDSETALPEDVAI